jgi:hypothetical protein
MLKLPVAFAPSVDGARQSWLVCLLARLYSPNVTSTASPCSSATLSKIRTEFIFGGLSALAGLLFDHTGHETLAEFSVRMATETVRDAQSRLNACRGSSAASCQVGDLSL